MKRENLELPKTLEKAVEYTINTQRNDGSWSGPVSGRLYETLIYALSMRYISFTISEKTNVFLEESAPQTIPNDAKVIESILLCIYTKQKIDITTIIDKIKDDIYPRKYLIAFLFARLNGYTILESDFKKVFTIIERKIYQLRSAKSWELVEYLLIKGIIYDKKPSPLLLKLKLRNSSFPNNAIAASIMAIFASKYNHRKILETELTFLKNSIKSDGSLGYYEIPIWDTGLTLGSHNNLLPNDVQKKGIDYIVRNANTDGGWGFIPNSPSELDTTAIILSYLGKYLPTDIIERAFELIKNKQQCKTGLWPVWKKFEKPSIEVVAHIILAIKNNGIQEIETKKARSWIESKVEEEKIDAIWCMNLPYSIFSIARIGLSKNHVKGLIERIKLCQNKDGGWGKYEGDSSNPSATANAVSLLLLEKPVSKKYIEPAIRYLIENIRDNGSWIAPKEVFGPHPFLYSIKASCHAFCVEALSSFTIELNKFHYDK